LTGKGRADRLVVGMAQGNPGGADPVLDEIVRRLIVGLRPARIYLFGSRARGEATEDSDYDILVVVADSDRGVRELAREALRLCEGMCVPVDVLVWTRSEFDRRARVVASLPSAVLREGKLLHAA
jgi:predicted nucleotidyltransferase